MLSDFHMHSCFSGDSNESPENNIKKAIDLGMKHICFTDHQDFDFKYDLGMFDLDYKNYYEEISKLKDLYKDKIDIRIGLEMGLEPHLVEKTEDFASLLPYDFVIGSTHLVKGIDPYYPEYFEGRKDTDAFMEYFEYVYKSVCASTNYDVYGHLDYVIRYAPDKDKNYSYKAFAEIIDEILKTIISKGKGIEVNTASLYKGFNETNPCKEIVKKYKELGGEIITVGADAHIAANVGYGFDKLPALLKECGFDYYCIFKDRTPEFIKL